MIKKNPRIIHRYLISFLAFLTMSSVGISAGETEKSPDAFKAYLEGCALPPDYITELQTPDSRNPYAVAGTLFDPELGYVFKNLIGRDGMDAARVMYSFEPDGARRIVNYRNVPCRINTYGDSFTQGNQVSDGETWQEALAAHFGEPIRNYGVGGHGVYQAYLRMKRMESGPSSARHVILNIWEDDHYRNIMASHWLHLGNWRQTIREKTNNHGFAGFMGMPWAHLRFNPRTGSWVEQTNPFNTPESVFRLGDPAFVYETYRNDTVVKLTQGVQDYLFRGVEDVTARNDAVIKLPKSVQDDEEIQMLARHFNARVENLYTVYALASTLHVVKMAKEFADAQGKQLIIILSYGAGTVARVLAGGTRFDQTFLDQLARIDVPVIDTMPYFKKDFMAYRLSPEDYCKRIYIGHFNPAGNHFFAYAIKDDLIALLRPVPVAYDEKGVSDCELLQRLQQQPQ